MPLVTRCPHCQKPAQVPDEFAGRQVRCPSCKQAFMAQAAKPEASAAAPTAAPPPIPSPASSSAASSKGRSAQPAVAPSVSPSRSEGKAKQAAPSSPSPAAPTSTTASVVISPAAPPAGPIKCPSCKAALPAGATVCLDCGWVQADLDLGQGEAGEQLVICTNPACGAANAPAERYCQRCNTMLPTAPGTLLHGRYKVEKLLAMGGFGAVYRAVDTKTGVPVAIKDMICADPEEFNIRLNFFRREAEILRSLHSLPVVPRVFDFIHQGQTAHLVMEFIKGQDLLKIMEAQNNKPFPVDQVVEWGKLICDVLHHMHTLSPPVVHRDMKPDNIMLLDGSKGIKLIDFGTARDVGRTHRTRLQAKTRVYTEGYAPPEQIIGKPEARSDLFALAGTLYHLATGKPPEGFYTAKEIEGQLKEGNGSIPPEHRWFYELIRINLSEDVNDRYFTAREFKADLEAKRVSTEAACPKCRRMNKVREPYCGKCAAPLTDETPPCYHCGKTNRMGSRCCIHCGNRLR